MCKKCATDEVFALMASCAQDKPVEQLVADVADLTTKEQVLAKIKPLSKVVNKFNEKQSKEIFDTASPYLSDFSEYTCTDVTDLAMLLAMTE